METTEGPGCREVADAVRREALDQLQAEVARQEGQFLVEGGDWGIGEDGGDAWQARPELNQYAIAEWAWGLLERQRAAITQAVARAFDDNDKETQ